MRINFFSKWNLDALGIGASLVCAVHCVLLPLLVSMLPLLGLRVLENESLEYALLAFSFVVGYTALFRGYRKNHGHVLPLVLFTLGYIGLLGGHFAAPEGWEPFVITAGAALIVWAHWRNLKGCRACRTGVHATHR